MLSTSEFLVASMYLKASYARTIVISVSSIDPIDMLIKAREEISKSEEEKRKRITNETNNSKTRTNDNSEPSIYLLYFLAIIAAIEKNNDARTTYTVPSRNMFSQVKDGL